MAWLGPFANPNGEGASIDPEGSGVLQWITCICVCSRFLFLSFKVVVCGSPIFVDASDIPPSGQVKVC